MTRRYEWPVLSPFPGDWALAAACRGADPDIFFVEVGGSIARAKAICAGCPVIEPCRDHAVRWNEPAGVWGGLSVQARRVERKRLRRRQNGIPARLLDYMTADGGWLSQEILCDEVAGQPTSIRRALFYLRAQGEVESRTLEIDITGRPQPGYLRWTTEWRVR